MLRSTLRRCSEYICSGKRHNIPGKITVKENVAGRKVKTILRNNWIRMFLWETCDVWNSYSVEHLWTAASIYWEAYLEPSRSSTMERFLRKYLTADSASLFLQKSFIVDVRLGSKYASVSFIKTSKNHYFKENKKVFLSENINIKMIFTQKAKNCLKFKLLCFYKN